ncbi:endonuclease/exonuclease/phosphatase family protein [Nesterenkonia sp. NBAIMH1]|uniref:endonuclease/exonuclease/phosphatase family protein n=1 Tax=Nesterenkonia sp. NBAIMH1 TaxID=2600320 RepID=UPI00143D6EE3|nr:endonuclease/exonuclease/phosphatase family protein [Nesterenkonia sp. NBAIMH1]
MTWNIRRRSHGPALRAADRWDTRAPHLRDLLRAEMPTVLGVQEALPDQAEWVHAALGDSYGRVGYGRARDAGDEAAPIFYDAQRLELLDWGQHALSRKPGEPGSRSWGSIFPRVFVAASFRDRDTGMRFQMINTHLDHLSAWARLMSARALSAAVQACPTPSFITGDFNTGPAAAPMRHLREAAQMRDAWDAAESRHSEEWGTFSRYRPPRAPGRRIDWILASPSVRVTAAGISTARNAQRGSDHLPVQAQIELR